MEYIINMTLQTGQKSTTVKGYQVRMPENIMYMARRAYQKFGCNTVSEYIKHALIRRLVDDGVWGDCAESNSRMENCND